MSRGRRSRDGALSRRRRERVAARGLWKLIIIHYVYAVAAGPGAPAVPLRACCT
jgi:hypothetical protein